MYRRLGAHKALVARRGDSIYIGRGMVGKIMRISNQKRQAQVQDRKETRLYT